MRLPRLFRKFQFVIFLGKSFGRSYPRILDHPLKRALLGSAVGLVVLLIILCGVWCIRRRELKRKKHLAILVRIFTCKTLLELLNVKHHWKYLLF